jgi:MscS family membrane protein
MVDKGMASIHAILPLGRRMTKAVLIILASIALLQNLGVNVSGLVAGLGIGGLAFALAAQKTIENLFGGATIIADQPVRVGDFCRFGDKIGTVEDIGLRSTRIRTLDRTVVTVPNAEFSSLQLENFAKRDRIRLHFTIGVRYETSADQLRHLLVEVKRLLVAHPKILPDPARVRFVNFGAHSLDLEIFCYIGTADWNEFLAIREDIYLRIMDAVENSGTEFAFPSQTLYLGRDGGLDREAVARAEKSVQDWRASHKLPLPDPTETMLTELDDSLDYPPEGSVAATT